MIMELVLAVVGGLVGMFRSRNSVARPPVQQLPSTPRPAVGFVPALQHVAIPPVVNFPYVARPLFSRAERTFLPVLQRCVPPGLGLYAKVRLEDVIEVPRNTSLHRLKFRGHIKSAHVDFLLVDLQTHLPVLVVELDDRSHLRPHARERDQFKDQALAAAGVPILRVRCAAVYDVEAVRRMVAAKLG